VPTSIWITGSDCPTTLAILAGSPRTAADRHRLSRHRQPTHIEQVAARLNPCVRVISQPYQPYRPDRQGCDRHPRRQQVTICDGILPWAYQHNVALVFDEYDAAVPIGVRDPAGAGILGRLTPLDQSRVIAAPGVPAVRHRNTVGLGDTSGLYHGTQQINQAQMDWWST
jgi:hypothetical protein